METPTCVSTAWGRWCASRRKRELPPHWNATSSSADRPLTVLTRAVTAAWTACRFRLLLPPDQHRLDSLLRTCIVPALRVRPTLAWPATGTKAGSVRCLPDNYRKEIDPARNSRP